MTSTKLVLLLAALALLVPSPEAVAQTSRNGAYFEFAGSAVVSSFNYERRFREQWYGRAGLSLVVGQHDDDTDTTFLIPLTASHVNRPLSNHHLELGGGVTFVAGDAQELWEFGEDDEKVASVLITGIAGYRYQKPSGGFLFRATFTPVVGEGEILPWVGLSFGYAW